MGSLELIVDEVKNMATHFFGLTQRTFAFSHSVGRNEFAGTGMRNPVDFVVAPNDTVYIVNRSYENRPDGCRISIFTLNEEYITEFGSYGEGDGQFIWPTSCDLDAQGNLYVADEWQNKISIFDKDGEYLGKWGNTGTGDGELNHPAGIAIIGDTLVLTDSQNHRVQKFGLDGTFKGKFGGFKVPGNFFLILKLENKHKIVE